MVLTNAFSELACLSIVYQQKRRIIHAYRQLGHRFIFYFLGFDAQKMFFLGSDVQEMFYLDSNVQEMFSIVFPFFVLAMRKLVVSEQSSGGQLTRQNQGRHKRRRNIIGY